MVGLNDEGVDVSFAKPIAVEPARDSDGVSAQCVSVVPYSQVANRIFVRSELTLDGVVVLACPMASGVFGESDLSVGDTLFASTGPDQLLCIVVVNSEVGIQVDLLRLKGSRLNARCDVFTFILRLGKAIGVFEIRTPHSLVLIDLIGASGIGTHLLFNVSHGLLPLEHLHIAFN